MADNKMNILKRNLIDVYKYREYIKYSSVAELKSEVENSYLGWIWWILDPLLFMMVYTFMVDFVFQRGVPNFPIFVFIGLMAWYFFSGSVLSSVTIIRSFRTIISKVYVPKFVFILIRMRTNLVKMGISFCLVFILMYFFGIEYSFRMFWAIPITLVYFLSTFAICILVAHTGVFIADLSNVMRVVLRFMFYMSGVIYSVGDRIPDPYRTIIYFVSPVTSYMEDYRNVLMYNTDPNFLLLGYWLIIGLLASLIAIWVMYKYENTYVKVL